MRSWSWMCMTTDARNTTRATTRLMASSSSFQIRQADKHLLRQNCSSVLVLSIILGVLSLSCSSALSLSAKDTTNIIRYFPYNKLLVNNERIKYPFGSIKRSGSVNFSPGWGKRSTIDPEYVYADEYVNKRAINFSPGWGKRSGGSVNFSPGWGKRSGGSVNFSPGWGKRAVNFSPSWGKRNVNFSPSWGRKRSGGSVNFSPGWGKRSGGSVNFSPGWGKRSIHEQEGLGELFDENDSQQEDPICRDCNNSVQDDMLTETLDSNNNQIPIIKKETTYNPGFANNAGLQELNQAYLNEVRSGIHNWKRGVEREDSIMSDAEN